MSELAQQIKTIQQKLLLLLKKHAEVQKENLLLKKQLTDALSVADEQKQLLHQLQQQLDAARLAKVSWSEDEKKSLEKKINAYLKEIDACLAQLNA